jgi:hypothetical protein
MGWSKGGLAKMSQVCMFRKNGGTITASGILSGKKSDDEMQRV